MPPDNVIVLIPVVDALDSLGIEYYVCGSMASSLYGVPRSTIDVDIVAGIGIDHIETFSSILTGAYYLDVNMIREAVAVQSSFNLIHFETSYKVDVFVMKSTAFENSTRDRVVTLPLPEGDDRLINMPSAEDVILSKMSWYRDGGEVSDQQWRDIIGVVRVQQAGLDRDYLNRWANELDVTELLERAWREVEADD